MTQDQRDRQLDDIHKALLGDPPGSAERPGLIVRVDRIEQQQQQLIRTGLGEVLERLCAYPREVGRAKLPGGLRVDALAVVMILLGGFALLGVSTAELVPSGWIPRISFGDASAAGP